MELVVQRRIAVAFLVFSIVNGCKNVAHLVFLVKGVTAYSSVGAAIAIFVQFAVMLIFLESQGAGKQRKIRWVALFLLAHLL